MRTHHAAAGKRGFTLVELMIVVAIIAVIAAAALPNLLASRLTANESSAIGTLRSICSAQSQARNRVAVDSDNDGQGEYLYLAELGGKVNLRGTAAPMDPAAVSLTVGQVSISVANHSGYHFAMYLPDAARAGVLEDPAGGKAVPAAIDADLSEIYFVCYAWPTTNGSSGRRTFAVNQTGDAVQTDNSVQNYSGTSAIPAFDAAYNSAGDMTSGFNILGVAPDGGNWRPLN